MCSRAGCVPKHLGLAATAATTLLQYLWTAVLYLAAYGLNGHVNHTSCNSVKSAFALNVVAQDIAANKFVPDGFHSNLRI